MNEIIQRVREKIDSSTVDPGLQRALNPPVRLTEIQEAETKLGCTFPDLLRNMYVEISNGRFGQHFWLLPIEDFFVVPVRTNGRYLEAIGADSVGLTYLVIHDWGCNVYSCIDHSRRLCPVFRYDAVGGFFIPEKPSFEEWVYAWVNGEHLWDAVMEEKRYETFVSIMTSSQDLNLPLLHVLSEWINKLLIEKT